MREVLNTSPSGFLHQPHDRASFDDSAEERRAFYETHVAEPGLLEADQPLHRPPVRPGRQRRVVRVHRRQDPGHRGGPGHRGEADPDRPPLRRAAASVRDRLLRDLQPAQRRPRRRAADTHHPDHRARHRDERGGAGARHHRVGDRLRLRDRRPAADGGPRPRRASARGPLGGGAEDLPRHPDHRVPELLLPRRAPRRRRQQPALQRRPGRLHHRHPRPPAPPRLRHHRGGPGCRATVDRHGGPGRDAGPVLRGDAATTSGPTSRANLASTSSTRVADRSFSRRSPASWRATTGPSGCPAPRARPDRGQPHRAPTPGEPGPVRPSPPA